MEASEQTNAAEAPPTFQQLNLSEPVKRALDEIGYVLPTPVQFATYDLAVAGRDIIVQARTGTGKTAAFAIPLVDKLVRRDRGVQALVLAPTRELALQSAREIARIGKHTGIRAAAVYGGAPMGKQIEELAEGAQIVSGTPGRVLDHLRRRTLDPSGLRTLVLDEMDEMLSMGFARELNAILELIPDASRRQTMCFSATVDGDVRRHAEKHMRDPQMVSLSSDAVGAEAISHHVYNVSGSDRVSDLVRVLEAEDPESAIIFCNLRSETEQVASGLKQAGFNADWLNGDLPQRDREKVMSSTREGKLRYLVATDVAARGIDISHLTHVINFSFPESPASYVHRTGRTGRAGRTGCAISLVSPQELGRLYYLRLEYKISPIERSLPSRGELQTRREADRVGLLNEAFAAAPKIADLALARRLLTHPEVERIVSGLLQTFFGREGEDVDEQAAAARRARPGRAVVSPEAPRADRERRGAPSRLRGRDGGERSERPDRPERSERPDRPERSERPDRRAGRPEGSERSPSRPEGSERASRPDRPDRPERAERPERPERSTRADRPERAERAPATTDRSTMAARPAAVARREAEVDTEDGEDLDLERGEGAPSPEGQPTGVLYLDVGRRDGVRVGEVARLMRDVASLRRSEVGRIRVRDRHTFVEVPDEKLEEVLAKLKGHEMNDKPLAAERAKANRV